MSVPLRRLVLIVFAALLAIPCWADMRNPGKYSGVVIFDRWDGCMLYEGIYITYFSEKVKEQIRPYAGQTVQVDVRNLMQPMNPGDAYILDFRYLGPDPKLAELGALKGLRLHSIVRPGSDGRAVATMTLENAGAEPISLSRSALGFTVMTKQTQPRWSRSPSDGPSVALITRQCFEGDREPLWENEAHGIEWKWTIGKENALPVSIRLAPGERKVIDITLTIPDGEYEFLCGYGGEIALGSAVIASNRVAFDIVDGRAKFVGTK